MEEFELYDKAIKDFIQVTLPGKGSPVPVVFATGSRAFQRIEYLYQKMDKRLTLPLMSIYRADVSPAPERFRYHPRMRINWVDANTKEEMRVAQSPQPIEIPYQIDIRAVKQKTLDKIKKEIIKRFISDIGYATITYGEYGTIWMSVKWDGYSDSSEKEPGEMEIKLRETLSLSFRGWIFRDLETVKTLKEVSVGVYDDMKSPEEFLEEIIIVGE